MYLIPCLVVSSHRQARRVRHCCRGASKAIPNANLISYICCSAQTMNVTNMYRGSKPLKMRLLIEYVQDGGKKVQEVAMVEVSLPNPDPYPALADYSPIPREESADLTIPNLQS